MEDLTFVTGNYGKYISVKEKFEKAGMQGIKYFKCDLDEPDVNNIEFISHEKARQAYEKLKKPIFVADSGFYIEDYPNNPGYPGAFVKRSGVSSNIDSLLEVMKNTRNRNCYFLDCLTFYDGNNYYQFFGSCKGVLSLEQKGHKDKKAKSNLWYCFIPNNCTKTLAEMTDNERANRNDGSTSATTKFLEWYQHCYQKPKSLTKRSKIINFKNIISF
jgi:XTP/dITP diphosphohydrolase